MISRNPTAIPLRITDLEILHKNVKARAKRRPSTNASDASVRPASLDARLEETMGVMVRRPLVLRVDAGGVAQRAGGQTAPQSQPQRGHPPQPQPQSGNTEDFEMNEPRGLPPIRSSHARPTTMGLAGAARRSGSSGGGHHRARHPPLMQHPPQPLNVGALGNALNADVDDGGEGTMTPPEQIARHGSMFVPAPIRQFVEEGDASHESGFTPTSRGVPPAFRTEYVSPAPTPRHVPNYARFVSRPVSRRFSESPPPTTQSGVTEGRPAVETRTRPGASSRATTRSAPTIAGAGPSARNSRPTQPTTLPQPRPPPRRQLPAPPPPPLSDLPPPPARARERRSVILDSTRMSIPPEGEWTFGVASRQLYPLASPSSSGTWSGSGSGLESTLGPGIFTRSAPPTAPNLRPGGSNTSRYRQHPPEIRTNWPDEPLLGPPPGITSASPRTPSNTSVTLDTSAALADTSALDPLPPMLGSWNASPLAARFPPPPGAQTQLYPYTTRATQAAAGASLQLAMPDPLRQSPRLAPSLMPRHTPAGRIQTLGRTQPPQGSVQASTHSQTPAQAVRGNVQGPPRLRPLRFPPPLPPTERMAEETRRTANRSHSPTRHPLGDSGNGARFLQPRRRS